MKDVHGEKRSSAVKVIIPTTMIIISPSGAEAASASRWHNGELRSRLSGIVFLFLSTLKCLLSQNQRHPSAPHPRCSHVLPSSFPLWSAFPCYLAAPRCPLPALSSDYRSPPSSTPSTPSTPLIKNSPPGSDPSRRSPR